MKLELWMKKIILFLVSQTISLIGSFVVSYAVIWYITIETSSGIMMTIAILCNFLPQIIISLFAGVWADRYNRKLLVIFSDLFIAAATLVLAILWLSGHTNFAIIFVVMAVRSIGSGIQMPAVNAIIPQMVPTEQLTRINAINSTITNVLTLIAPALGGVLLAAGLVNALFFDVVTCLLAVITFSFLRVPPTVSTNSPEIVGILGDLKAGLAYVRQNDWLRFMLIFYAIGFFLISPASFLSPIFVERVFGPEVWRLTANEIAWSLGAVIGGGVVAVWGGFRNRVFSMAFSYLFFGITFVLMGLAHNFWYYLSIMTISGLFLPLFTTSETTLIQEKTDPHMMGRVFAIINIIVSAVMPLGMIMFGPLADVMNVRYIIVGTGVLTILVAVFIMSNQKFMTIDTEGRPGMKRQSRS
ncbi:MAG: MFS transporter [Syntrophomonadaceae bacterium]|nr:MFS transporter [Syntrophomonadaceae bacterium]